MSLVIAAVILPFPTTPTVIAANIGEIKAPLGLFSRIAEEDCHLDEREEVLEILMEEEESELADVDPMTVTDTAADIATFVLTIEDKAAALKENIIVFVVNEPDMETATCNRGGFPFWCLPRMLLEAVQMVAIIAELASRNPQLASNRDEWMPTTVTLELPVSAALF